MLKGLIEHDNGAAYFYTMLGYSGTLNRVRESGWATDTWPPELTEAGTKAYKDMKLSKLPKTRYSDARGWNWDKAQLPEEESADD